MGQQALDVLGHTGGVVCSGAADALDHVHTITRLLADGTVVLWAAEVSALLGHLSQLQALGTPARRLRPKCEGVRLRGQQILGCCFACCCC